MSFKGQFLSSSEVMVTKERFLLSERQMQTPFSRKEIQVAMGQLASLPSLRRFQRKSCLKPLPATWRMRRWLGEASMNLSKANHVWPTLFPFMTKSLVHWRRRKQWMLPTLFYQQYSVLSCLNVQYIGNNSLSLLYIPPLCIYNLMNPEKMC